jgi:hypothetical protein
MNEKRMRIAGIEYECCGILRWISGVIREENKERICEK